MFAHQKYLIGSLKNQARLAQSVERKALNLVVVGSSPTVGVLCTISYNSAHSIKKFEEKYIYQQSCVAADRNMFTHIRWVSSKMAMNHYAHVF